MNPFAYLSTWRRARLAAAFRRFVAKTWGISEDHPMFWFAFGVERVVQRSMVVRIPPRHLGSHTLARAMEAWNRIHRHTRPVEQAHVTADRHR